MTFGEKRSFLSSLQSLRGEQRREEKAVVTEEKKQKDFCVVFPLKPNNQELCAMEARINKETPEAPVLREEECAVPFRVPAVRPLKAFDLKQRDARDWKPCLPPPEVVEEKTDDRPRWCSKPRRKDLRGDALAAQQAREDAEFAAQHTHECPQQQHQSPNKWVSSFSKGISSLAYRY